MSHVNIISCKRSQAKRKKRRNKERERETGRD
jgi:hypothetical protein